MSNAATETTTKCGTVLILLDFSDYTRSSEDSAKLKLVEKDTLKFVKSTRGQTSPASWPTAPALASLCPCPAAMPCCQKRSNDRQHPLQPPADGLGRWTGLFSKTPLAPLPVTRFQVRGALVPFAALSVTLFPLRGALVPFAPLSVTLFPLRGALIPFAPLPITRFQLRRALLPFAILSVTIFPLRGALVPFAPLSRTIFPLRGALLPYRTLLCQ